MWQLFVLFKNSFAIRGQQFMADNGNRAAAACAPFPDCPAVSPAVLVFLQQWRAKRFPKEETEYKRILSTAADPTSPAAVNAALDVAFADLKKQKRSPLPFLVAL